MIPPKILPVPKLKIPQRKGYKPNKVGVCHVHQLANGTYQITRKNSRWMSTTKRRRGITKYYYSSKSLDNVLIVLEYLLTHDWEMPEELPPPQKWNGGKPRNRSRYTAIRYIQQLPTENTCFKEGVYTMEHTIQLLMQSKTNCSGKTSTGT